MMTNERFLYLLQAYGAVFTRWPEAEREMAREALSGSEQLQAQWRMEEALDDVLALPAVAPAAVLRETVIASAVGAGLKGRRERRLLWTLFSGAGFAATAAAGAVLGVLLAQQIVAPMKADTVFYQASLQGADDTDVLGTEMASLESFR